MQWIAQSEALIPMFADIGWSAEARNAINGINSAGR
jgi:hypothetical protein